MNRVLILGSSSDIGHELILKFLEKILKFMYYNSNKPEINSNNVNI